MANHSNMKVSDMIRIFNKILKEQGDLDVVGECEDCTTSDMSVYVLTDPNNNEKCWIQVSSDKEYK